MGSQLSSTLAEALLGGGYGDLAREVTAPVVEAAITVPSERCPLELAYPAGTRLARAAPGIKNPADQLRVGLEAHWLLVAASESQDAGPQAGFGAAGHERLPPPRGCATQLDDDRHIESALAVMSRAPGVGQHLTPSAVKAATARENCDCSEQHARLLEQTGDSDTAIQAREAAAQVRRVFPHPG
jgi:hypothetical protein